MKEVKPTIPNAKHKTFVSNTPLFRLLPKQEIALFIATLELEIKDYYKDKNDTKPDVRPP